MISMAKVPQPKRGEIWQVWFDPSVGAEIRKRRPAVVMNLDGIGRLPVLIVVPITDWQPAFASFSWFVFLPASPGNGLSKDSGADVFQVKSVSEMRFIRKVGEVTDDELDEIAAAIALCVGAP
jgi:mRNA interferase MazF